MAEEPAELRARMAEQRNRISDDLEELGMQLDSITDWKTYVRRHPWWALGAGVGAGFLLSKLGEDTRHHASQAGFTGQAFGDEMSPRLAEVRRQAGVFGESFDRLLAAAVGAASKAIEDAVVDAFPAIRPHLEKKAS